MENEDQGSKIAFLKALNKVQGTLEPVSKDKLNPHFKSGYASLAAVNETIMGPLAENGFIILSGGVEIGGKPWLRTTLLHVAGHSMSYDYPLLVTDANPQHLASATTYARRYSLCAFFNLSTEDDDGNAAATNRKTNEIKTVTRIPASTVHAGGEFTRFVPSNVVFTEGKGKGAGKTFSKITSPEGTVYDANELQGEIADSAKKSGMEIVLAFKMNGNYRNATNVKMDESKPVAEIIEEVPF